MKPNKVYKYRSGDDSTFDRDLNTLVENCFFAPSFNLLNDPCETFIIDTLESDLKFLPRFIKNKNEFERVKVSYNNLIARKNDVGIYSLSNNFKDELLWSHYANSHKGFCIEYDLNKLLDNFSNEDLYYFPVKYSRIPPHIGMNDIIDKDLNSIVRKISGTKSRNWKYENEIRIIRNTSGKQVYDHKALTSIYFGLNMEMSKMEKMISKLIDRGVNFYQIKQAKNSYKFQAELILEANHQENTYLCTIPQYITLTRQVNYTILDKKYETFNKKGKIEIILEEKINSNSLLWIAELIKKHIFNSAERIFMFYWVKSKDQSIPWATTHFKMGEYELWMNEN